MSNFPIELKTLIRANHPVIWVVTHEEDRFDSVLINPKTGIVRDRIVLEWSQSKGLRMIQDVNTNTEVKITEAITENSQQAIPALQFIEQIARKTISKDGKAAGAKVIVVLRDLHRFLKADDPAYRYVRDLASMLKTTYAQIIITSPVSQFPAELEKDVTVIDMPLPDRDDLHACLDELGYAGDGNGTTDALVQAGLGLTRQEYILACTESLARHGSYEPKTIVRYKEQTIRKSGVLELYQTIEGLDDVGGLSLLKDWISVRALGFTQKAKNFGVHPPKGLFLTGPPGTGKTLTAKALASFLGIPLLVVRADAIFSKYVGESEQNLRSTLRIADAVAPCILFIDEVEKFLAGAGTGGGGDSGVSRRVFGSLLTWMSDHKTPVLVVATSNDPTAVPPEFASRFDATFFVDLPTSVEREQIFGIHLRHVKRDPAQFDLPALADRSEKYSGREIEQILNEALFRALSANRELNTQDILSAISETKPLAVKRPDEIRGMQLWATQNARDASPKVAETVVRSSIRPVEAE